MARRKGQNWWNYIGNAIPVVKLLVKGENDPNDTTTNVIKNAGYNLNSSNSMGKGQGLSPYIMPAINAGSQIIGSAINANAQKDINEQQIAWAMQNYQMSRQDAIDFWNRENEYNSPKNQMQRLREGGLNPHLVYGNGATATGGSISSPQYQTPNLKAPQYGDAITGVGNVLATQMMQAQIDKTKAETRRIDVDQETQAFDLSVKTAVGLPRLQQQLESRISRERSENAKIIRDFDTYMEVAYGNQDSPSSDSVFFSDGHGGYTREKDSPIQRSMLANLESNELINKARQAGLENTIQELNNIKKKGVLYDDQHALNQIEISIKDFSKSLTNLGISPNSTQFLGVIVSLLRTVFGK